MSQGQDRSVSRAIYPNKPPGKATLNDLDIGGNGNDQEKKHKYFMLEDSPLANNPQISPIYWF